MCFLGTRWTISRTAGFETEICWEVTWPQSGNPMTPARRSGLEMKFCSKKKCRWPGFSVIWTILYPMTTPPFWKWGFPLWKIQTWGHSPVVREACGPVCALRNAHGFSGRFPLWTKAEIHPEDKEVRFMACKEKTAPEMCACEKDDITQVERKVRGRGGQSQGWDGTVGLDCQGLNPGFDIYKLCDLKQISWIISASFTSIAKCEWK